MQGIILAAGSGTRLRSLTTDTPKALLRVGERPLIDYARAFLRAVGVRDVIVVAGPQHAQLTQYLAKQDRDITVVHNKQHKLESLSSLAVALPFISESFIQIDVDFIYTWDIAARVRKELHGTGMKVICTSHHSHIPPDMVKVRATSKGTVVSMEKDLPDFSYGYVGMFYCAKPFLPELRKYTTSLMESAGAESVKVWSALTSIAKETDAVTVADIGAFDAIEIDTPEELQAAEAFVKKHKNDISRYFD